MRIDRRRFLLLSLATAAACARRTRARPLDPRLAGKRIIRVVQFTDIHWGQAKTPYREDVAALIELTNSLRPLPLFVVCTGDNIAGDDRKIGLPGCRELCEAMRALKVPWIWVWGNHDGRSYQKELEAILDEFGVEHRAPLRKRVGNINFVFLDSGNGLHTSISDDQLEWFESEFRGDRSPVFAFFHIPVIDRGVDDDEQANQDEVVRRMQAAANLRACFFGHDHEAQTGVFYKGTLFCHGRRSGGYGRNNPRRGVRVIDIAQDGSFFTWTTPDGVISEAEYYLSADVPVGR